MQNAPLRIADHCDKLFDLTRAGKDDAAISSELDRVCDIVLGASIDDVDEDAIKRWYSRDPAITEWKREKIVRCAAAGFDITSRRGAGAMLWAEEFALVIWARSTGAVVPRERS
jgi:hypothetical protein